MNARDLLLYLLKFAGWIGFATLCMACFWGLVGLVGMLIEPPRGGRR